jgi:hypothetical protein
MVCGPHRYFSGQPRRGKRRQISASLVSVLWERLCAAIDSHRERQTMVPMRLAVRCGPKIATCACMHMTGESASTVEQMFKQRGRMNEAPHWYDARLRLHRSDGVSGRAAWQLSIHHTPRTLLLQCKAASTAYASYNCLHSGCVVAR